MHDRRTFLGLMAGAALAGAAGCRATPVRSSTTPLEDAMQQDPRAERMPVLFVGHGSPMNVIEDNTWSRGFSSLREQLPRPRAILAISAHWYVGETLLTSNANPRTIHDFSGFPQALYEITYPAPGQVDLAQRVRSLIGEQGAQLSPDWGLDHGTWSVLRWMYPEADIPVIQLSLNRHLGVGEHYELGRSLEALRHEGVLIFSSGNIVHNLRDVMMRMRSGVVETPEWARRYDDDVAEALRQHDADALLRLWPGTEHGRLAHPSPDHWLPLLYAVAATNEQDAVRFPIEGFDMGSISMRTLLMG